MFNSLKSKFIVSFVSIELIILSLIISLNFNSLDNAAENLISEKNKIANELLVELIKTPMIVYDLATIDDAISNFANIKNVVAVIVQNNDNVRVSSKINETSIPLDFFENIDEVKNPYTLGEDYTFNTIKITIDSQDIGHVHIIYSIDETLQTIQHNKNIIYILALISLLVGLIIAYIVGNNIGKSLQELTSIAKNVAEEKRVLIPYSETSQDEINKLYLEMHKMQENITERTSKLNSSNNNLQQFVNALNNSAIVSKTDVDGNITNVNRKFCEITGFSEEELIGQTHRVIKDPELENDFFKNIWDTISSKQIYHGTFRNIKKNGEPFWVDATISPLLNRKGEIQEYIAIRFEVTEIVNAKNRAEEAKKIKEQFLSNMSHEIRTPLTAILGFANILKDTIVDEESLKYINVIDSSSHSLLHIINDILDISKIENNKLLIDKHEFNPLLEFNKVVDIFEMQANQKNIDLSLVQDSSIPECLLGDLLRIKQILFNLLSNALKFTDDGKKITLNVSYDSTSSSLGVSVTDEGIGLSKNAQNKIFSPFEQADNSTTRKYGGTGLGLSISIKLAKLMQGDISLNSVEGVGSTFSLSLPLQMCEPNNTQQTSDELEHEDLKFSGHLLIAEDNKTNQMLIKILLTDYGLNFTIANDGLEAVEKFKDDSYDLVLMDENMPNMTGTQAFEQIKIYESEKQLKHTPIVTLTANSMEGDKENFIESGMDDFLAKPINTDELERVLKKFL